MLLDMLCCYNGALLPGDVSMCLWCLMLTYVFNTLYQVCQAFDMLIFIRIEDQRRCEKYTNIKVLVQVQADERVRNLVSLVMSITC